MSNADETSVFMLNQHYSWCKMIEISTFQNKGREKLRITVMLSVLADGKETDTICYSEEKKSCERNLPSEII
jgi:hypothetical protein